MTIASDLADFLADPDRITFTVPGLPGSSASKMTPEEELEDCLAGEEEHVARVDTADGVTHMRVFPDRESAGAWATGLALSEHAKDSPIRCLSVKPRRG